MTGPEARRTTGLGGMFFLGAALLALAALGLQWRSAPAVLRDPFMEVVFVTAGLIVLGVSLVALARERRTPEMSFPNPSLPREEPSEPSLMALPAMVAAEPSFSTSSASAEPVAVASPTSARASPVPAGLAASEPRGSTLLIPFADESTSFGPPTTAPSGQTVSRLVDRMDALQRVAPSGPPTNPPSAPSPEPETLSSRLLLRLTRIPTPPAPPSATSAVRRCTDCGDSLGSPPQFESCVDCGRALCERCYWRTSSGPQAHLCTTCFKDRSVPRPPAPAVPFVRPGAVASVSTPSGRSLQPRRPAS